MEPQPEQCDAHLHACIAKSRNYKSTCHTENGLNMDHVPTTITPTRGREMMVPDPRAVWIPAGTECEVDRIQVIARESNGGGTWSRAWRCSLFDLRTPRRPMYLALMSVAVSQAAFVLAELTCFLQK